jgi:hypothetical protein
MYKLYDKAAGEIIGEIDEVQRQFLMDELEEESPEDQDYYLNRTMIGLLGEKAAALSSLVEMLKEACGEREALEIEWVE